MSTFRLRAKVRVKSGPAQGQTGRVIDVEDTRVDDGSDPHVYLVQLARPTRLVTLTAAQMERAR
ncbi:hypothetical protein GCM10010413_49840 [Promicromonospora sukumoe]|uniref:KOW domain-containing protein n=1 Tax=Promicromonospora sukumoe TaxID=88382 RepID=A0A7W3JAI4_9MICO|nr:hypothetical protein [Promicromonospora sukumoe]MBA8809302.1 hypothetical protein [Promicromonospora sukumoe]